MNKDVVLCELERIRKHLLDVVNAKIDMMKQCVENGESLGDLAKIKTTYPLSTNPVLFKGTKPTAIYFGDEKVEVKTWRKAYTLILHRCADNPQSRESLMYLRNKVSGRKRKFLSDKPDGINVPIQIADELFAEGYFDTEWLVRVLTTEILNPIRYDYSDISVAVVPGKRQ